MDDLIEQDCPGCRKLAERVAQLEALVEKLQEALDRTQRALEKAQRSGKRQAAPFRKKKRSGAPQKPGRKSGDEHGHHAHRTIPNSDEIDERYDVPLPGECPHCGGHHLTEHGVRQQYQTEIPRRPIVRQFDVHCGCCNECGKAVQGRHELQTSDALGAAASQLGPDLHAALAICNKELGLSHGKARTLFERLFGIKISRSTSIRRQLQLADKLLPSYGKISGHVRGSPWVVCDETGWRVEGDSAWLHDFVTDQATLYWIDPHRDGEPAEIILGEDYAGVMIHDGWSVYDRFTSARHQQCLAHLLRRCGELLEAATGAAARFPWAIKELLQRSLAFRDRFRKETLTRRGLKIFAGRLTDEMQRLISRQKRDAANERFAKHLRKHVEALFTFLREPEVDATNWRAEQAIRPAVVNRKVWGGNRTWDGANAQSILTSVLVTCGQQGLDALQFLSHNLKSQKPLVIPIVGR
jgi:transposase